MAARISIRSKLVVLFVLIKVVPLMLLAGILWLALDRFDGFIAESVVELSTELENTIEHVGEQATLDAVEALDNRSREAIERLTTDTARDVARFLYARDKDVLQASSLPRYPQAYQNYLAQLTRAVTRHGHWNLNAEQTGWTAQTSDEEEIESPQALQTELTSVGTNNNFHQRPREDAGTQQDLPLYVEITFVDLNGQEQLRVAAEGETLKLRDVSQKQNTYLGAETYYDALLDLEPGEIYVSDVIGEYVGSPVIGAYTPEAASKRGIEFSPELAAYAGKENPVGQRFQGIIRWATPVVDKGEIVGFVTLALDHAHVMEFTDHIVPTDERYTPISDASTGNYAFMWDRLGRNISHPRDYFIVGYDRETGEQQMPWLEQSLYADWKSGNQTVTEFLRNSPSFDAQSLEKKPSTELIREGLLGLDCRYLNFAPQCTGWMELTAEGGSGSFLIFWSGLWKLTTAATIPYFTGQYGESERGFGFVTIGANVDEFHEPAVASKQALDALIDDQLAIAKSNEASLLAAAGGLLKQTVSDLTLSTLLLTAIVIGIAFWMAGYLTRRITVLSEGVNEFEKGNLDFRLPIQSNDEIGALSQSINTMAAAVESSFENVRSRTAELQQAKLLVDLAADAGRIGFFTYYVEDNTFEATDVLKQMFLIQSERSTFDISELYQNIPPTEQASIKSIIQKTIDDSSSQAEEFQLRKDPDPRWVRVTTVPKYSEKGRIIVGAVVCITRLKLREIEARSSADRATFSADVAGLGTFEVDPITGVVLLSPLARHLLGVAADPSKPVKVEQLIQNEDPEHQERSRELYRQARMGIPIRNTVLYQSPEQSEPSWLFIALKLIDFENDKSVFFGAVLDITEQIEQERSLQSSVAELTQRREEQQRMFAIIGHELRTPVTSMKMMMDEQNLQVIEPYGRSIVESTESLLSILDDLRVVIHPEQILIAEARPESPGNLITRTMRSLVPMLRERGLTPHFPETNVEHQVYKFDAQSVRQILTNLIKNAAVHSEASDLWVTFQVVESAPNEQQLQIRVSDNGKGIPLESSESLFEAFARGDTQADGTGLGLHISREFARRIGGELHYEPSPMGGACFVLSCKIEPELNRKESPGEIISLAAKSDGLEADEDRLSGLKVLLAEDQRTIQMLSKKLLEKVGASVVTADNGAQALDKFQTEAFDLVITDLMMPELDGFQLTEQLREMGYTGPIIAVTAAVIGEETERLLSLGATAALPKPLNLELVRNTLKAFKPSC